MLCEKHMKKGNNMTKLNYEFLKNVQQATKVYEDCEKFLRKVEEIGSFGASEEYGAIDWMKTAIAFSVLAPNRIQHLEWLAKEEAVTEQDLQKVGYDFIMVNCCYENSTAYYLEAFRQKFVKKNTGWNVTPFAWVASIRVERDGKQYFKYFGHTSNPLYVK